MLIALRALRIAKFRAPFNFHNTFSFLVFEKKKKMVTFAPTTQLHTAVTTIANAHEVESVEEVRYVRNKGREVVPYHGRNRRDEVKTITWYGTTSNPLFHMQNDQTSRLLDTVQLLKNKVRPGLWCEESVDLFGRSVWEETSGNQFHSGRVSQITGNSVAFVRIFLTVAYPRVQRNTLLSEHAAELKRPTLFHKRLSNGTDVQLAFRVVLPSICDRR